MSLINFHISDVRITVVTDTLAVMPDGQPVGFTCKFLHLPHLGGLIAHRGTAYLMQRLGRRLDSTWLPFGFDDLTEGLPDALRDISADQQVDLDLAADSPKLGAEVLAFGYSAKAGKMRGYLFTRCEVAGRKFNFEPIDIKPGVILGPGGLDGVPGSLPSGRPEDLVRFAERQQKLAAKVMGHAGVGGDLIEVQLTKHKTEIRKVKRFADYAETAAHARSFDVTEWMEDYLDEKGLCLGDVVAAAREKGMDR